jgi:hypothetical protein
LLEDGRRSSPSLRAAVLSQLETRRERERERAADCRGIQKTRSARSSSRSNGDGDGDDANEAMTMASEEDLFTVLGGIRSTKFDNFFSYITHLSIYKEVDKRC